MKAQSQKYTLKFKQPAGTSRGILYHKDTYLIKIEKDGQTGYGECNLFRGLSADDRPDYEDKLNWLVTNIHLQKDIILEQLKDHSSLIFGYEQALWSFNAKNPLILFPSKFTEEQVGIPINGLVWMGNKQFMFDQIKQKISEGYHVIKLKIGAIDFNDELDLLKYIRQQFTPEEIEIRLDANGAFSADSALKKMKYLSDFSIHSIEQPIKQGQMKKMAQLCEQTPIPIALDEELIGYNFQFDKLNFLKNIKPQYIILKPALHGGYTGADTWIEAANKLNIGWWITSALESNIGLNGIAQYTYQKDIIIPQGLGTGSLYSNNIDSPLFITNSQLFFDNHKNLSEINHKIAYLFK